MGTVQLQRSTLVSPETKKGKQRPSVYLCRLAYLGKFQVGASRLIAIIFEGKYS